MKKICLLALLILTALVLTVTAQTVSLKGRVVDPQSAVVVGADVVVKSGNNIVAQGKSGPQGLFDIPVPAGQYTVLVDADGFALLTQAVRVTANMAPVNFPVVVAKTTQEVTVQEDAGLISLDASANLTATVLDEDFIQQLPDDPDDLAAYLSDLAGPRANAAGGIDFIIDGFANGVLPPKEQILQIKINNNPFSTEFQRPGFGRIEIVTKPGTGQYHGNAQFNFRDQALNANTFFSSPFSQAGVPEKAPYQRRNFVVGLNGPIVKGRATISINATREDDNPSSQLIGTNPLTFLPEGGFVTSTSVRNSFNTRGQWGLTKSQRHIVNFNLQYGSNNRQNQGVGGIGLPTSPELEAAGFGSNAYGSIGNNEQIQLREMEIINANLIHEARVEWDRNASTTNPYTLFGYQYTIQDAAQFGSAGNHSHSNNTNVQFANALSYTAKWGSLKTGFQAEHFNQNNYSLSGYNGSYGFSSLANYQAGIPNSFNITTGNPTIAVTEWQVAPFVQTEIKVTKKLMVSPGVRYQIQTHLNDHNDIDPRFALAYQVTPTVVARGGFGIFHQSLGAGTVAQLLQNDGKHQLHTSVNYSSPGGVLTAQDTGTLQYYTPAYPINLSQIVGTTSQIDVEDPNLRTPYTINSGVSLEKAFKSGLSLSGSFDDIKSVHLYRGRDINAIPIDPLTYVLDKAQKVNPPAIPTRPNPSLPIVDQLESTGNARFDSLTLGARDRIGGVNVFGSYTYSRNYGDSNGPFGLPMDNFNLHRDWAVSSQNTTNHYQATINYKMPNTKNMATSWMNGILINSNITAGSGRPYTLDYTNPGPDSQGNVRPTGVSRNSLIGPSSFNMSMNFNKTIVLKEAKSTAPNAARGDQGPGGGQRGGFGQVGGGGRGGPGGGGPGGGGGGGGRGGGAPGGGGARGTTMTIFLNTTNVLNHTNLNNPSGTIGTWTTDPTTGALAVTPNTRYGIITGKGAPRVAEVGLRFNF